MKEKTSTELSKELQEKKNYLEIHKKKIKLLEKELDEAIKREAEPPEWIRDFIQTLIKNGVQEEKIEINPISSYLRIGKTHLIWKDPCGESKTCQLDETLLWTLPITEEEVILIKTFAQFKQKEYLESISKAKSNGQYL